MSSSGEIDRKRARVLVVGVGGIGAPVALVLARAGVGTLGLVDDDRVERTNLHRQVLFAEEDVGRDKLDAAASGLVRLGGGGAGLELHRTRFVPENAIELTSSYDVVVEGADNFATKFLVADACRLASRAVVHAAAVRTTGNVLAVSGMGRPCYRCLFEDLPREQVPNCDVAGVLGPLVGLVAAVAADLALSIVDGRAPFGQLAVVDINASPIVRRRSAATRASCELCGPAAPPSLDPARYVPTECAS